MENWVKNNKLNIIELRRWLHQHPEIGFKEHMTSKKLISLLKSIGYSIVQNNSTKTGFFCDYYGGEEGPILAIRCDMDGLLIKESSKKPYISENNGVMHACGHDVHMSIVYGVAKYIKDLSPKINGSIRFIFQPAEEQAPGGAIDMIKGDAIREVDHIVAAHVFPALSADKIGIKHGPVAAFVDMIEVELTGSGGHTSRPIESIDLVWAQSHLILSLEESLRHHVDQQNPFVLAFGHVKGGATYNVLPSKIILKGTLRYLDSNLKDKLYKVFEDTVNSVSKFTDANISWKVPYSSPGLINDKDFTTMIIKGFNRTFNSSDVIILDKSSMGGEDFAYYLEHIPGSYFRIGCYDGKAHDVHIDNFDVDEDCLITGIKAFVSICRQYFSIPS